MQDVRIEFNEEIETLKRTEAEIKMELKTPKNHLENSRKDYE